MSGTNHTEPSERFPWALCAALTALALALRLYRLGFQALFLDEYGSWRISSVPGFGEFIRTVWLHEANPPLHFILLRGWMALFGDSPISLRMPSVLFGTATVWVMMRVVWDAGMRSRFAVATVGVLVAVSPYALYYSQEARAYAMLLFLTALILLFVVRIWSRPDRPRTGDLAGLAVVAPIAAFTHYFALFALFFGGVALAAWRLIGVRRAGWRSFWEWRTFLVVTWLAGLLVAIVLASLVLSDTSALIAWLPKWTPTALLAHWRAIASGPLLKVGPVWAVPVTLCFWVGALLVGAAGRREDRVQSRVLCLALLAFLLLALLPHAVSAFRPILFKGQRYMIVSLPAFWFATALAASRARWRLFFVVMLVGMTVCRPMWFGRYYTTRHKRVWDQLARVCERTMAPGDLVWYLAPYGRGPLLYHLRHSDLQVIARRLPTEFSLPSEGVQRVALVGSTPFVWACRPPEGFEIENTWAIERGNERAMVCLQMFRRADGEEQK